MNQPDFGRLRDVDLRAAWAHEAHQFTPWLAANLDRLGDALGIELELIEAEAGLPSEDDRFSADIHARDPRDDSTVLIENQLATSDHTHMGQIMTYLAGLDAKAVVWVAPQFREAHLAVLKWLNEHTPEEFSFFALKVRVVQIGDSPMAPLFDVLEKPNQWERRLQTKTRAARAASPEGDERLKFWTYYRAKFPDTLKDGEPTKLSVSWRMCANETIAISYFLAKSEVGIFVRGLRGETIEDFEARFEPFAADLEASISPLRLRSRSGWFFLDTKSGDFTDNAQFDELAQWLHDRVDAYEAAINKVIGVSA